MPTSGSLTTDLRYDIGEACEQEGDRLVMVAGTVTDRLGATAELCDRESKCPFVAFAEEEDALQEMDPATIIEDVKEKLGNNQITGMQAVDELTFAVEARQGQVNRAKDTLSDANQSSISDELVTVLSMVQDAAEDALSAETRETPRVQGMVVNEWMNEIYCIAK